MISGIFAGGTSKIIEYTLDTIKVLCQINTDKNFSTFQLTKNTLQNEGITRIYRGLSAPLFGSCLEYFTTFWMFSNCIFTQNNDYILIDNINKIGLVQQKGTLNQEQVNMNYQC